METVFMEFLNLLLVLGVDILVAGAVSCLYATGLRFFIGTGVGEDGQKTGVNRPVAYICFAACICIVVFALWLIIPAFHG